MTNSQIVRNQHLVHFPVKRSSIPDNSPVVPSLLVPGKLLWNGLEGTPVMRGQPSTQVWWMVSCATSRSPSKNVYGMFMEFPNESKITNINLASSWPLI